MSKKKYFETMLKNYTPEDKLAAVMFALRYISLLSEESQMTLGSTIKSLNEIFDELLEEQDADG